MIQYNDKKVQFMCRFLPHKLTQSKFKHPLKVMFWGFISSKGPGRLQVCEGIVNTNKYINILQDKSVQWFPHKNWLLQ